MSIKISIIIPSYNRYPLNLWSLYALENQTVNQHEVEIIFIDDGSTDETPVLQNFQSRYKFIYIRNEQNKGRSFSRNIGIEKARGEIILFLDAEMLTEPDFIQNHINYHKNQKKLVVCGTFYHRGVFTMNYPEFSSRQSTHIQQLAQKNSFTLPIIQKNKITPLMKKEDIETLSFKKLSFENPYFIEIAHKFGDELKNYPLPWTIFLTGNVSLKKELLVETGNFDEDFKGWGYEDWEMGYRLVKKGARIISKENIKGYHQEHPVSANFIENEMLPNFYHFQQKHHEFEVCVHALFLIGYTSRISESTLVKEYNDLVRNHPNEFNALLGLFLQGLNYMAKYLASVPQTMDTRNINRSLIRNEKQKISELGKYNELLDAFQFTCKKIRLKKI